MSKLMKFIKREHSDKEIELQNQIDNCPNCDDYPEGVYRIPFNGYYTCAICHAPIMDNEKYDSMLNGIRCHKSCMMVLASVHGKYHRLQTVGMLRIDSHKKYGLRK